MTRRSGKKRQGANKSKAKANNQSINNWSTDEGARDTKATSKGAESKPNFPKNYASIYLRYKEATEQFFRYILDNTPENIQGGKDGSASKQPSINTLVVAVEWMAEQKHEINPYVLKCLRLSIKIRSKVADSVFGGGDSGHKYLLEVLTYCWSLLNPLCKKRGEADEECKRADESRQEPHEPSVGNRFAVFGDEDENDEEELTEEPETILPSGPVARPKLESEPLSLEDLMRSDTRYDAGLFLYYLNRYTGIISLRYQKMTKVIQTKKLQRYGKYRLATLMAEVASTVNFCIQRVQQLEMDLIAQHNFMSTPFRMLAVLFFPEPTEGIDDIMRENSSSEKKWNEEDIYSLLGDFIEHTFLYVRESKLVEKFCTKFGVNENGTSEIRKIVQTCTNFLLHHSVIGKYADIRPQPKTSLFMHEFIGKDRGIQYTLRMLAVCAARLQLIPRDSNICVMMGLPPVYGKLRDAKRMHPDLDEIFSVQTFPDWVLLCREGMFMHLKQFPFINEIAPLFLVVEDFIDNPHKSISWALAFSIHGVMTAMFETRAISVTLVHYSKTLFQNFFETFDLAMKDSADHETNLIKDPQFCQSITFLQHVSKVCDPRCGNFPLWNPLWGGTLLSYLCFFGNLEAGCSVIDEVLQLRSIMYLFHSLKLHGFVEKGEIELLDDLYEFFKPSKALWKGPLPQKGECAKRFLIGCGMNIKKAQDSAKQFESVYRRHGHTARSTDSIDAEERFQKHRLMQKVNPWEISKSYRRVLQRDFHDIRVYRAEEQRRGDIDEEFTTFEDRRVDLSFAMLDDDRMFSTHFFRCGVILEVGFQALIRRFALDPEPLSDRASWKEMKAHRQHVLAIFCRSVLAPLDYAEDPSSFMLKGLPLAETVVALLKKSFADKKEKVNWYSFS